MAEKKLIVVCGPTASGKTAFGINLAKKYNTEIISADSRQFYEEISIGTAKPSNQELSEVKHHFIGFLSIHQNYNAGQFEVDALQCLDALFKTKDVVIMVGGSGLYIDAVCKGFDALPQRNEELRKELSNKKLEDLQAQIKELDPIYCTTADLNNRQRIIRAIEICLATKKSYSDLLKASPKPRSFTIKKIALKWDRTELYDRINNRVDQMIESGLVEEAKAVYPFKNLNSLQTVGYKELFSFFENQYNLQRAIELIKQNTRRYAKRQLTWLNRDSDIEWVTPSLLND